MPEVDHETERMLSGTPVHVHQLRDDAFMTSAVKQGDKKEGLLGAL